MPDAVPTAVSIPPAPAPPPAPPNGTGNLTVRAIALAIVALLAGGGGGVALLGPSSAEHQALVVRVERLERLELEQTEAFRLARDIDRKLDHILNRRTQP